jgi:hypothetical protein
MLLSRRSYSIRSIPENSYQKMSNLIAILKDLHRPITDYFTNRPSLDTFELPAEQKDDNNGHTALLHWQPPYTHVYCRLT